MQSESKSVTSKQSNKTHSEKSLIQRLQIIINKQEEKIHELEHELTKIQNLYQKEDIHQKYFQPNKDFIQHFQHNHNFQFANFIAKINQICLKHEKQKVVKEGLTTNKILYKVERLIQSLYSRLEQIKNQSKKKDKMIVSLESKIELFTQDYQKSIIKSQQLEEKLIKEVQRLEDKIKILSK